MSGITYRSKDIIIRSALILGSAALLGGPVWRGQIEIALIMSSKPYKSSKTNIISTTITAPNYYYWGSTYHSHNCLHNMFTKDRLFIRF